MRGDRFIITPSELFKEKGTFYSALVLMSSHVQDDYCRPSESAPGKEHATNMSIYWWLFESAHTASLLVYRLGYGPFKAEGESMMISQDKTFCTLTFKLRNIELKFCSC